MCRKVVVKGLSRVNSSWEQVYIFLVMVVIVRSTGYFVNKDFGINSMVKQEVIKVKQFLKFIKVIRVIKALFWVILGL